MNEYSYEPVYKKSMPLKEAVNKNEGITALVTGSKNPEKIATEESTS